MVPRSKSRTSTVQFSEAPLSREAFKSLVSMQAWRFVNKGGRVEDLKEDLLTAIDLGVKETPMRPLAKTAVPPPPQSQVDVSSRQRGKTTKKMKDVGYKKTA